MNANQTEMREVTTDELIVVEGGNKGVETARLMISIILKHFEPELSPAQQAQKVAAAGPA